MVFHQPSTQAVNLGPLDLLLLLCLPVVWESQRGCCVAWSTGTFLGFCSFFSILRSRVPIVSARGPSNLSRDLAVSMWKTGIRILLSETQICFSSALLKTRERIPSSNSISSQYYEYTQILSISLRTQVFGRQGPGW